MVCVSVTGLRPKRPWCAPLFWWRAVRCFVAAQRAGGNISAKVLGVRGIRHTLTVWTGRKAAMAYVRTPVYRRAVAVSGLIATGRTFGYGADCAPD